MTCYYTHVFAAKGRLGDDLSSLANAFSGNAFFDNWKYPDTACKWKGINCTDTEPRLLQGINLSNQHLAGGSHLSGAC